MEKDNSIVSIVNPSEGWKILNEKDPYWRELLSMGYSGYLFTTNLGGEGDILELFRHGQVAQTFNSDEVAELISEAHAMGTDNHRWIKESDGSVERFREFFQSRPFTYYIGEIDVEEALTEDGRVDRRYFGSVECVECKCKFNPYYHKDTLKTHSPWVSRWVGCDHKQPEQAMSSECPKCKSIIRFTIYIPQ